MFKLIFSILTLATVYAVSGKAALSLTLLPGYATAVFPSAGIALAALVRYGISLWPGVFLGALALHIWIILEQGSMAFTSISFALITASAASLQCLLGFYLCFNKAKVDFNLPTPKDIFNFMLLAGPVACLLSATLNTSGLLYLNILNYDDFLYTLFTKWASDCVGIVFFTPITLCLLSPNHKIWADRRYVVILPLVIILVGGLMLLSISHQWGQVQSHHQFEDSAKQFIKRLQIQVTLNLSELSAIERFFISSDYVDRAEFQQFTLSMLQENKSLKGLSWNPLILDENRGSFIAKMQQNDFPTFQFMEKNSLGHMINAATRPYYIVVKYIEPYQKNQSAQGYDVSSELSRKQALMLSKSSKAPIATATIQLVQAKQKQQGFLIFYPVFKEASSGQLEGDGKLQGFVVGVYNITQLLNNTLRNEILPLNIQVSDISSSPSKVIYTHNPQQTTYSDEYFYQKSINIAQRQWQFKIWPNESYFASQITWKSWLLPLGNIIFSALFTGILLIITGNAYSSDKLVKDKTATLKQNNAFIAEISHIQSQYLENADIEWFIHKLLSLITHTFKAKYAFIFFYPQSVVLPRQGHIYDKIRDKLLLIDDNTCPNKLSDMLNRQDKRNIDEKEFAFRTIMNKDTLIARFGFYDSTPFSHVEICQPFNAISSLVKSILRSHENHLYIENLATTDSLTGLHNRFYFKEAAQSLINENKSNPNFKFSIMLMDLNKFKAINDYYGHHFGDELLKKFSRRIKKLIKPYDVFARVGGDEFILLAKDLSTYESSGKIAQRIFDRTKKPYCIHGSTIQSTVSIGICCYPESAQSYEDLLTNADLALYEVKRTGRAYAYFSKNLQTNFLQQTSLEKQIEIALQKAQFTFLYQPQYAADGKYLLGYESLIRWPNAKDKHKSPGIFIDALERMGKSKELNEYVVRNVIAELNEFDITSPIKVSINISPQVYKFGKHIMALAETAAHLNQNPKLTIVFEITESKLMNVGQYFNKNSAEALYIRKKNILLALDDFGVSYSSLNRLLEYDFSFLKIDLSFIRKMVTEEQKDSIHLVEAIINIGLGLKLSVIAEGVETKEQLDILQKLGCHYIQGYYFGKPEPAANHLQKADPMR